MSRLRIVVDFPWDASACMGTGAYSETMVRALAHAAPEDEIILAVSEGASRSIRLPNVRYELLPSVDAFREAPRQVALPLLLRNLAAHCLFAPATLLPVLKACPMVTTVHDLTFLRNPEYYAAGLLSYLDQWFDPSLRAATHVIAISDEARRDLVDLKAVLPEKVTVLRQPVRESFHTRMAPELAGQALSSLSVTRPFFFHVSNLGPHKNLRFALEVFAKYLAGQPNSPHTFVIAGGGYAPNRPPDFLEMARALGIDSRVHYVGKLDDHHLKALYQTCDAFLFPSLAEGWGLPVAEAATLGARVLASPDVPSAPWEDRIPLEIDRWVQSLCSAGIPTSGIYRPPDFDEAGRGLYQILARAAGRAARTRRSRYRIAIRADWRSPSGFGQAARNTFAALKVAGLTPIQVPIEKDSIQDSRLSSETFSAPSSEAEVWVHHLPPTHFDLSLSGRHVALFCWETDQISPDWVEPLNALDEIWVPTPFLKEVLPKSGVRSEIVTCPIAIDTDAFSPGARRPPRIDLPSGFDPSWTVFLYVGTWDPRKRPDVLVRAFSKAFRERDRALLVVKSYVTGKLAKDREILNAWMSECHSGGAHIRLIPDIYSSAEMVDLFRFATVFATASRGEGYCLPAAQAMSCAKPVLAASWSALADLVSIPVQYRLENVARQISLPGYDTVQRWAVIDEDDLARQLAWVHSHRAEAARLGRDSREWILQQASLPVVGRFLSSRLDRLCEFPKQASMEALP